MRRIDVQDKQCFTQVVDKLEILKERSEKMCTDNTRRESTFRINSAQTQAADKLEILKGKDIFRCDIDGPGI